MDDFKQKPGFIWQHRTIDDAFLEEDPSETMKLIWDAYNTATELLGSGKLLKEGYNHFMESKWAEVYRKVYGADTQQERYKLGEIQ